MKQTTINWSEAQEVAKQAETKKQQHKAEFEQTKAEAKEEVMERIYETDEPFSYDDIEDIMHGHGLEMDYIEEFLL